MRFEIEEKTLHFKQPAGTSRGVYTTRKIWLVRLSDGEREGVGECAPLPDLSCDAREDYREVLEKMCEEFCRRQESQRGQSLMCSANSAHEGQSPCVANVPFKILGRKDNVICSGGIKIQAEEVERMLKGHLSIPYLISKRPDKKFGEVVVMLTEGDVEEAKRVCEAVLPKFQRPKAYIHVSEIPMTETKKPARRQAEELAKGEG